MKKTVYTLIGSVVLVIVYLFIISSLANGGTNSGTTPNVSGEDGADIVIGVGENVGVSVVRPRWYGTIVENHYSTSVVRELCLFNVFCIPNEIGGVEMIWIHMTLVFVILAVIILCIFIDITERRLSKPTQ